MLTPDEYAESIVGAGAPVFTVDFTDGACTVAGDLDLWAADAYMHALDAVDAPARVDLSGVTFLDSVGISALVRALQRGRVREYVNPSDAARRVLEVTGLADVLLADAQPSA